MSRNLLIMISASLGFFFVTATTFTSLGYVLYTMVSDLGWSQAAAGASFSLLGLACGLSSPLPPMLMKAIGTRMTMVAGALVLAAGFLLASTVHAIGFFFLATSLMGAGFSLVAPTPAVFLIATWFPKTSARMIGFYFMSGAFGGVAGPLVVSTVVGLSGSWHVHWMVMAIASVVLALIFLMTIRDAAPVQSTDQIRLAGASPDAPVVAQTSPSAWTVRTAMASPTFLLIAFAMVVVQTVVTTMHSVLVTHVATFGHGSAPGALAMSLLALAGTLAKGSSGALSERCSPKLLLVAGLALQALALALLSVAHVPVMAILAACIFGVGWGLAWLTAHVLLLRYFGAALATELIAMATMSTTIAVLGPLAAGWMADRTGSFALIFVVYAALLLMAAAVIALLLRAPTAQVGGDDGVAAKTGLVPAE